MSRLRRIWNMPIIAVRLSSRALFCIAIVFVVVLLGALYVRLQIFEARLTKRLNDLNISINRSTDNLEEAIDSSQKAMNSSTDSLVDSINKMGEIGNKEDE